MTHVTPLMNIDDGISSGYIHLAKLNVHDDVIKMETFSALLALCAGNSLATGGHTHKGQWRRALMFSLTCASWGWWFEMPSRSLWRHCNELRLKVSRDLFGHILNDKIIYRSENVEKNASNFVPLNVGACVGTVMIKFGFHMNTETELKRLMGLFVTSKRHTARS